MVRITTPVPFGDSSPSPCIRYSVFRILYSVLPLPVFCLLSTVYLSTCLLRTSVIPIERDWSEVMRTPWVMRIRAHAKINLSLRVIGRRQDGYHELKTVFQALALHDSLEFTPRPGPLVLSCDDPAVPTDERNLVWQAATLVWQTAGRRDAPSGVEMRLAKRVPVQGGLGGGSTDAAAALLALSALWSARLDRDVLARLAGQLGADVPYFLVGGRALGLGRGDEILRAAGSPAGLGCAGAAALRRVHHRGLPLGRPGAGVGYPAVGRTGPFPAGRRSGRRQRPRAGGCGQASRDRPAGRRRSARKAPSWRR